MGQEAEPAGIARDLRDDRVDLVEAPRLLRARVAGHRARSEPDDADARTVAVAGRNVARHADAARHGARRVIVGGGYRCRGRLARLVHDTLGAVDRRAVHQDA